LEINRFKFFLSVPALIILNNVYVTESHSNLLDAQCHKNQFFVCLVRKPCSVRKTRCITFDQTDD